MREIKVGRAFCHVVCVPRVNRHRSALQACDVMCSRVWANSIVFKVPLVTVDGARRAPQQMITYERAKNTIVKIHMMSIPSI